jgi:hypothetical protein
LWIGAILAYPARIATTPITSIVLFVFDAVAFVGALDSIAGMFFCICWIYEETEYNRNYQRQGLFKSGDM